MEIINQVWTFIQGLLPRSPFQAFYNEYVINSDLLKNINWFLPVGEAIAILEAWILAVTTYYLISAILRFAKIIS